LVELERIAEKVESILGIELMFMVSTLVVSRNLKIIVIYESMVRRLLSMDKENYKSG